MLNSDILDVLDAVTKKSRGIAKQVGSIDNINGNRKSTAGVNWRLAHV